MMHTPICNTGQKPCEFCEREVDLLIASSDFSDEAIYLYRDRNGFFDSHIHSWAELGLKYGFTAEEACFLCDSVNVWLDANSPYRDRERGPADDPHHKLIPGVNRPWPWAMRATV